MKQRKTKNNINISNIGNNTIEMEKIERINSVEVNSKVTMSTTNGEVSLDVERNKL